MTRAPLLLRALVLMLALCAAGPLHAQTSADLGEGLRVTPSATPGDFVLSWWGSQGRTYFVQQSFDLVEWNWVPTVESGAGGVCGLNFSCTDTRQFWRLIHTDAPTGGNALTADFDGDGISNADEVSAACATDPFLRDSDWDGYPDAAEVAAGTNPNSPSSPGATAPGAGPLNPDASYRNGLRLAYACKGMNVNYNGATSSAWAAHVTASGSVSFYPDPGQAPQNLTSAVSAVFEATPFLPPDQHLFQTSSEFWLTPTQWKTANGTQTTWDYTLRYRIEVQAQPSPAAPADASRSLVAFYYEEGTTVGDLKEAGTITLSQHNVSCAGPIARHCQIVGNKVGIEPKFAPNPPDIDPDPVTTYTVQNLSLRLMDVDIEPDAVMAGVVGDVVKSARAGSRIRHFVTPKKSAELPQDYVEFTAQGVDATTFAELFEWQGGEPGSAANKRKVKRDATGTGPTKLEIWTKKGFALVDEMHVWVVWAPVVCNNVTPTPMGAGVDVDHLQTNGFMGSKSGTDWSFEAVIQPASIVGASDIPDLKGPPTNPDTPPESIIGNHALDGNPFVNPKSKWDLSRCWRAKIIAPTVSAADCDAIAGTIVAGSYPTPGGGTIIATTPTAGADHFPTNKLEGNDYRATPQDPYATGISSGKLLDNDAPRHFVKTSAGAVGDQIDLRYHFCAFSRLQIGGRWYGISDRTPWRFHAKYRKASEAADHQDHNGDGDKLDDVWIDAGTLSDDTNGGF